MNPTPPEHTPATPLLKKTPTPHPAHNENQPPPPTIPPSPEKTPPPKQKSPPPYTRTNPPPAPKVKSTITLCVLLCMCKFFSVCAPPHQLSVGAYCLHPKTHVLPFYIMIY